METRRARFGRALLGARPRALLSFAAPAAVGVGVDLVLRAGALAGFALQGKAIYASSLLVSAAFWSLPLWLGARLFAARRPGAVALFLAIGILPIATLAYGGQVLYYRVFHVYMGRDTVRLGVALRGTVGDWLFSWGSSARFVGIAMAGAVLTAAIAMVVRRASKDAAGPPPILLVVTFVGALVCLWFDGVDSRFLQAATPDVCFLHGAVHAVRVAATGQGALHQGLTHRTPAPLPPLASVRTRPPNVVLVMLESVRADALCSLPPPACVAPFLDDVARDRIPLGRLRTQTPNTFATCMMLWTGLSPNVDFPRAHAAPVLWELARAVGYRTAYVTSQNTSYENFGTFVQNAGIDHLVTATDLGGVAQEQLGAPDERATAEALRFVAAAGTGAPYFAVVHLSNTHAPYEIDPSLRPFTPDSDDPVGDTEAFHNRYRNSVRRLERTLASFLAALRALPSWDDTVVVVVSDHGEQFREHGALYHNHSLHEEELDVPGFVVAGARGLDVDQRAALATYARARTYHQDVHATVVDLFGIRDAAALPLADPTGRSLVEPRPSEEAFVLIATSTAVWEPDEPFYGALAGERKVVGTPNGPWGCFDVTNEVSARRPAYVAWCIPMIARAKQAFGKRAASP